MPPPRHPDPRHPGLSLDGVGLTPLPTPSKSKFWLVETVRIAILTHAIQDPPTHAILRPPIYRPPICQNCVNPPTSLERRACETLPITTEITNTNSYTTMQSKPLKPQFKPKPLKSNPLSLKDFQPPSLRPSELRSPNSPLRIASYLV